MKTRVLVVDDSPTIRKVVSSILERHGYDAVTAADGQRALEILGSAGDEPFDLVLVDFVMPRMNGFQFCRALRERPEHASMPVVLMSARTEKIRDQFVQQTGAIDAITKPFDAQALVAVIEHAMRRLRSGRLLPSVTPSVQEIEPSDPGKTATGDVEVRIARAAVDLAKQIADAIAPALGSLPAGDAQDPARIAGAIATRVTPEALKALALSVQALDFSGKGKLVMSGDIAAIPVGAVLQLLQVEQKSGVLAVSNARTEVTIAMTDGLIDFVEARNADQEFRLGRFFIEQALVTPAQLDEVLARQSDLAQRILRASQAPPPGPATTTQGHPTSGTVPAGQRLSSGAPSSRPPPSPRPPSDLPPSEDPGRPTMESMHGPQSIVDLMERTGEWKVGEEPVDLPKAPPLLGDVLIQSGYVTEAQLREALARQSSELTYELLRWQRGRFEFRKEPVPQLAISARLALPVAHIVMEGFRRVDEWRMIESRIDSFDAVLQPDRTAIDALDELALAKGERLVLDLVDGERTVREVIAASHMSSFDGCKVLYQLLEARLVRKRAA